MSELKRYFINPIPDEGGAFDELPNVICLDETPGITYYTYVRERTCHMEIVKKGLLYVTYRFDCCGRKWTESLTDAGATDLPGTVCPFCGARVVE